MKAYEQGLLKGAKVLLWVAVSAVLLTLGNWAANFHPGTVSGITELGVINAVLVWLTNWVTTHEDKEVPGVVTTPPAVAVAPSDAPVL